MQVKTVSGARLDPVGQAKVLRVDIARHESQFNLIRQGAYGNVDPQIGIGTFPMERERSYYAELEAIPLIQNNETLRLYPTLERMREHDLTPATAHECLALGAQCGNEAWFKHGWLHALGTVMEHDAHGFMYRYVLSMRFGKKKHERDLELFRMESVDDRSHSAWTWPHRFLVVKRRFVEEGS